jgi:ketosteroid isomerase-like protein
MDTKQVAEKLVDFCRRGKNLEAVDALYDKDIVSVEAQGSPEMPAEQRGIDAIRRKHQWWNENMEVHSAEVKGPFANGDKFTVLYDYDFTPKKGPRKGQRTKMQEVGLYILKNGKIVREEFFY